MLQRLFFSILMRRNFLSQSNSGFSLKMINFCKNINCPTSQDLLAFQNGETLAAENKFINRHLSDCEFCAAEAEIYAHFAPAEADCAETQIPRPLYELAEALLQNKQKNFSLLNRLLNEVEGVKV